MLASMKELLMNLTLNRLTLMTLALLASTAPAADISCVPNTQPSNLSVKAFDLEPQGEGFFGAKDAAAIIKVNGMNSLATGTVHQRLTRVGNFQSYSLKGGALGTVSFDVQYNTVFLPGNCTRAGCGPAVEKTTIAGTLNFLGESHAVSCEILP